MISLVEARKANDHCETDRNLLRIYFCLVFWGLFWGGFFCLGVFVVVLGGGLGFLGVL